MGLFSSIGKIAGAAVGFATGGVAGAKKGYQWGGKIGGVADSLKGKKKGKGGYIQAPSSPDDLGIDFSMTMGRTSSMVGSRDPTKVAAAADLDNIWQPTANWWIDLGGDEETAERFKGIEM